MRDRAFQAGWISVDTANGVFCAPLTDQTSSGRRRTREAFRHRSASTLDIGRPIRMRAGGGAGVKGDLADRTQRDGETILALLFSFPTRMTPDPLILTMSYGGNLSGLTVGACSLKYCDDEGEGEGARVVRVIDL